MMHKIIINGHEEAEELSMYYDLEKSMNGPEEKIIFTVHTATDTNYSVTSAQVRINCEEYKPGGISKYSFIMPDTDVEIDVAAHGAMVNTYMNGSNLPSMSMMGMSMMGMMGMGMNSPVNADAVTNSDPYPWEGKPKFCPECGAFTKLSNKFCRECGTPFLPME